MISILKNLNPYLALLILIGCQSPKTVETFDRDIVTQEVTAMLNAYHKAMKDGGLAAEFDYLDESDDFFWVPPGYQATLDYDSIKAILMASASSVQSIDLEWEALQIFPLSEEIATYSGIVQGTMTDSSGAENSMRIIESGTLIKRADGWKLLSGQSAALNIDPIK